MEAFLTHTSTSPNHQLVASLDVARKQMELEGFAMVKERLPAGAADARSGRERSADLALPLGPGARAAHPGGVPPRRGSPATPSRRELGAVEQAFADDEFVLDPTRLTIYTALTGKSGFEFRSDVLMNELRRPGQPHVDQHRAHERHHRRDLGRALVPARRVPAPRRRARRLARPRPRRGAAPVRGADPRHHRRAAAAAGLQRLSPGVPHVARRRGGHPRRLLPRLRPRRRGAPAARRGRRSAGSRPRSWSRPASSSPTRPASRSWSPASW